MSTLRDTGLALTIAGAVTAAALLLRDHLAATNLAMVYLLGVAVIALRCRRPTAVAASVVCVALFDFFCVPPYYTFRVSDSEYLVTFGVTLTVALLISAQTARLKELVRTAREREARTDVLFRLSDNLAGETRVFEAVRSAAALAEDVFGMPVVIFLPAEGKISFDRRTSERLPIAPQEQEAAQWCFEHRQRCGAGSAMFSEAKAMFVPVSGARDTFGVMAVIPGEGLLEPEQQKLLEATAAQAGAVVERMVMRRAAEEARVRVQTEEMRSSLLSAVSHDLRTPLAAITGAASTLRSQEDRLDPQTRSELLESISEEAERLGRLVANLLDMTRFEAGGVQLQRDLYPVEEIVGSALQRMEAKLPGRLITTELPEDLPLLLGDDVLLGQVFWNLLENAAKYTPEGSPIEIAAWAEQDAVTIEVRDRGPGIPAGEETRIFEKFYRRGPSSVRGAGLGLAICRAIVTAHHGSIRAANREGGGAAFRVRIPVETAA